MDSIHAIRLIDHLIQIKRGYDQHCKALLAEHDLRTSDMTVLMFLAMHPKCHTAKEICEAQMLAKSLVSQSVETLVNRGMLRRECDPLDRRRQLLTLQPAAWAIVEKLHTLTDDYMQPLFSGVDPAELKIVERVFAQISHTMNSENPID